MLMEWVNHTWSCSPNMLAELLEPEGSGLCWEPAEQCCSQPCLHLPWEPPEASILHHLVGLLINCNCSSLGATWQEEEIYSHCPASPVSPAACRGAELRVLPHLPQSLGCPPACSTLAENHQRECIQILFPSWWLWSPGQQKNPTL